MLVVHSKMAHLNVLPDIPMRLLIMKTTAARLSMTLLLRNKYFMVTLAYYI